MTKRQEYLKNVRFTQLGAIISQPAAGYPDQGINWLNVIVPIIAFLFVSGVISYIVFIFSTTH